MGWYQVFAKMIWWYWVFAIDHQSPLLIMKRTGYMLFNGNELLMVNTMKHCSVLAACIDCWYWQLHKTIYADTRKCADISDTETRIGPSLHCKNAFVCLFVTFVTLNNWLKLYVIPCQLWHLTNVSWILPIPGYNKTFLFASFLNLGHTHYILRLTDPENGCSGLSEIKK